MNNRHTIEIELKELGSSLPFPAVQPPFALPPSYFGGLADAVLNRLHTEGLSASEEIARLSPLLSGISRTLPYSVPVGYFQENLEVLPAWEAENEPFTQTLAASRDMPFALPQGYFEGFSSQVMQRVERPQAKVVPLFRRKWMRVAAAAVMTGVIALSGLLYFRGGSPAQPANNGSVATELKTVSTKDLDAFIKAADASGANTSATASGSEARRLLKDVSDKDLETFLNGLPEEEEELSF